MALSDPRVVYGIHSLTPRSRTTGLPYGLLKVIGSANLSLTSDIEQLYAGSNKFAWAAENKTVSSEITAKVKAYPGFLFDLFLGATTTEATTDTAGTVSTMTNVTGTSIVAATGLASIAVKSAQKANLKFGKYLFKALTSTTLAVYAMSDIDLKRGTDAVYTNDTLLLTITIGAVSTGTTVSIDDLGLQIVGGASATAFVVSDTATFEVLPPSTKSSNIVVGGSSDTFPAFSCLMLAQKRSTGEMFEIDAHNCVGGGLPISLEENAFSQPELKMTCLYDSTLDRVFTIRTIFPS